MFRSRATRHDGISRTVTLAVFVFAAVALALGLGLTLSPRAERVERELAVLGRIPEFSFTDQDGEEFSSTELAGKVWVADFFFTRCSAACPRMTTRMLQLQRAVSADAELAGNVHLVSFSVDPGHDDPKALGEFARNYGADTDSWTFLTGSPGEVARLSQTGFLLGAAEAPSADDSAGTTGTHSDRFCLVDRFGRLRGHYRPTESPGDLDRLLRALRRLAGETSPQS